MPEVYIYMAEGRTVDEKRTVAREVTDVLIKFESSARKP
jgi:phenylpyruvate tautomerase PptA (4-oxalocrotonate tautomerase family)